MSIFYYFPLLKTGFSLRSFRWPLLAFSQDHFKPRSLHLQVLLPALSSTSWKCKWSWSHCGAQKIQRSRKLSRGAQGDDLKGEISTFQIMRLFFFFFCRSAAVRGDRLYIKDGHSHRLEKSHFFEALIFQKPDVMADLCTVTNGCSPPRSFSLMGPKSPTWTSFFTVRPENSNWHLKLIRTEFTELGSAEEEPHFVIVYPLRLLLTWGVAPCWTLDRMSLQYVHFLYTVCRKKLNLHAVTLNLMLPWRVGPLSGRDVMWPV